MGMLVDKQNLGFGMRSWRYAMVVDDGEIERMFIEAGMEDNHPQDPFEVSDADTVLAYLENQKLSAIGEEHSLIDKYRSEKQAGKASRQSFGVSLRGD